MITFENQEAELSALFDQIKDLGKSARAVRIIDRREDFDLSLDELARRFKVGQTTMHQANQLKQLRPDLFEKVRRNELSINPAYFEARGKPAADVASSAAASTRHHQQIVANQKRSLTGSISEIGGMIAGLEKLKTTLLREACSEKEIRYWAQKAEAHARNLREFANQLRGHNGKRQSTHGSNGSTLCSPTSHSPYGTEATQQQLPETSQ